MSEPREFPLGVVLSMATGVLLCDFGDLHAALDYMAGESLMTHQLPRVARECEQAIVDQHPDLAGIEVPDTVDGEASAVAFLRLLRAIYGETRSLLPLATEKGRGHDGSTSMPMIGTSVANDGAYYLAAALTAIAVLWTCAVLYTRRTDTETRRDRASMTAWDEFVAAVEGGER